MSGEQNQPPDTTQAADASQRLRAAGFTPIQEPARKPTPHGQRWQNKHGKVVYIDYTDETLSHVWTETLETALKEANTVPAHPWSSWWRTIFGDGFRPS